MLATASFLQSLFFATAILVVLGSSVGAAELATLRTHSVRAYDLQSVVSLVGSIVPADRVIPLPANRELVVFAIPSLQDAVAERIAAHEQHALLFERIDLLAADPRQLGEAIRSAWANESAREAATSAPAHRFNFEIDATRRKLLVWGSHSQLETVKHIVQTTQRSAATPQTPRTAQTPQVADKSRDPEPRIRRDDPTSVIDQVAGETQPPYPFVPVPTGPVRIVLIEGLDVLLIRAGGGSK